MNSPSAVSPSDRAGSLRRDSVVFVLLLLLVVVGQITSGAYTSELAESDEPSHFISGLLVRDYLAAGWFDSPLQYARDYYSHYPKIGIGNWPPLFYAVEGLWMLPFPANPASVLVLVALVTAAMGWLVYRILRPTTGTLLAVTGAVLVVLYRPIPIFAGMVMLDNPHALTALVAALFWARFMDRPGWRRGASFGLAALFALLVKLNAFFLFLLPPLAVLIGRRWEIVRSRGVWAAALLIVAFVAPWVLYFLPQLQSGWLETVPSLDFFVASLSEYAHDLVRTLGIVGTVLVAVGLLSVLGRRRLGQGADASVWVSAAALLFAVVLFHVVVPAGIAFRYLIAAVPVMALFAAAGAWVIAGWLRDRGVGRRPAELLVVAVLALAYAIEAPEMPDKEIAGFGAAAEVVTGDGDPATALVVSGPNGEGAFIAEVAVRDDRRPCHVVWRGTSLLSLSTWAGRDYRVRAEDHAALLGLLQGAAIEYLVIDRGFGSSPHQEQLESAIAARPDRFRLVAELPIRRRDVAFPAGLAVYRFERGEGEAAETPARLRQVPGYDGVEAVAGEPRRTGRCEGAPAGREASTAGNPRKAVRLATGGAQAVHEAARVATRSEASWGGAWTRRTSRGRVTHSLLSQTRLVSHPSARMR